MKLRPLALLSSALVAFPSVAFAHAFGVQYTLPLPVALYVTGGVGAFVASCVVLLFFSDPIARDKPPFFIIKPLPAARFVKLFLRAFGTGIVLFAFALAFLGAQDYIHNPLPDLFWVIFLLLFTYFTALVGGLWDYLNPFSAMEMLFGEQERRRYEPYWLPFVPTALFLALLCLELFSYGLGAIPVVLGALLALYMLVCQAGSMYFGAEVWFVRGELFSTLFLLIGKFAPIHIEEERVIISWPGEGLVQESAAHISLLIFILVMLGSTILDGLQETNIWWEFIGYFSYSLFNWIGMLALLIIPFFLLGLYSLAVYAMKVMTHTTLSFSQLQLRFTYSLVPIAIAYHFAHYFTLILTQGQAFIAQMSDPFNKGWDIFGTAGNQVNIGIIGADKVWLIQLSAIVIGHVIAAIVAHRITLRVFSIKRDVIVSQLPLMLLMVFYTAFGLWTLAQPFAR